MHVKRQSNSSLGRTSNFFWNKICHSFVKMLVGELTDQGLVVLLGPPFLVNKIDVDLSQRIGRIIEVALVQLGYLC